MRLTVIIAALLGTMALGADALADGPEPSTKDAEYAPPKTNYSYSYGVRQSRGSWECPAEFNRRECRRMQAEIDTRRAREIRRTVPRARVAYVDRTERRYDDERPRSGFGGKRCGGFFKVEGEARLTERGPYSARNAAIKAWRHRVRTEGPGERYIDERYSPNFTVGKCRIVGDRGALKRCTAEGIACQP